MQLALPFDGNLMSARCDESTLGPNTLGLHTPCRTSCDYLSHEQIARVLSRLRGESLLMAQLIYGCGLSWSELSALRIGDVNARLATLSVAQSASFQSGASTVAVATSSTTSSAGREPVPSEQSLPVRLVPLSGALLEDIRNFVLERACGRQVMMRQFVSRGAVDLGAHSHQGEESQPVFTSVVGDPGHRLFDEGALEEFDAACSTVVASVVGHSVVCDHEVLQRSRAHHMTTTDAVSPLDLFERGPLIVRRDRPTPAGEPDRYYLWRFLGFSVGRMGAVAKVARRKTKAGSAVRVGTMLTSEVADRSSSLRI